MTNELGMCLVTASSMFVTNYTPEPGVIPWYGLTNITMVYSEGWASRRTVNVSVVRRDFFYIRSDKTNIVSYIEWQPVTNWVEKQERVWRTVQ